MSDIDDQFTCPKCGGTNEIKVKDRMEAWGSMLVPEYETTCRKCGHENYWAYGYYRDTITRHKHFAKLRILLLPIVAALELISFALTLVIQLFSIQAAQEIVKFWEGMPDNDWYLEGWKR